MNRVIILVQEPERCNDCKQRGYYDIKSKIHSACHAKVGVYGSIGSVKIAPHIGYHKA